MPTFIIKKFELYAVNITVVADDEEDAKNKVEQGHYEYFEDPKYEGDLPSATLQLVEEVNPDDRTHEETSSGIQE